MFVCIRILRNGILHFLTSPKFGVFEVSPERGNHLYLYSTHEECREALRGILASLLLPGDEISLQHVYSGGLMGKPFPAFTEESSNA